MRVTRRSSGKDLLVRREGAWIQPHRTITSVAFPEFRCNSLKVLPNDHVKVLRAAGLTNDQIVAVSKRSKPSAELLDENKTGLINKIIERVSMSALTR